MAFKYNPFTDEFDISGSGALLKVNGTSAGSQSILNLIQGSGITITDNGAGGITIASTVSGGGTVTSVAIATANGVSGVVATATTTPSITITLGAITPTSVNGLTITTSTGTLTITNAKTLSVSDTTTIGTNSITFAGGEVVTFTATNALTLITTGSTSVTLPTSGTLVSSVTTANGVSAVNTAGALTFTLGAITPTTVNGNTFTTGTYTLTGQAGKTLTFNGTITLTGTDAQTYTFPTTTATLARTDTGQTFAGSNIFSSTVSHTASSPFSMTNSQVVTVSLTAQTTGAATLTVPNFAGVSDTFVFITLAQTLSNKTFVAPALGAATATSINGLIITTTAATLTLANSASAALITSGNFSLTLTATATTNATFPSGTVTLVATTVTALSSLVTIGTITSGGLGTGAVIAGVTMTLGSDASFDIYYRNGSGILTRLANGSTGQALLATTSAAPSWGLPTITKEVICATSFESTGRITPVTSGSGTVTMQTTGMQLLTGATSGSHALMLTGMTGGGGNEDITAGSPSFGAKFNCIAVGTSGSAFMGIGKPTVSGTGHTFTDRHTGFKILYTAGPTATLYATQADGTTETASAALTTIVATQDQVEVFLHMNGTSSVDYYWRLNGGAWSAATNLTTNMPNSSTSKDCQFSVSNNSTTQANTIVFQAANYRR